ncbi:hypothetical protein JCM10212_000322 [Sporobolomyces blumeae]
MIRGIGVDLLHLERLHRLLLRRDPLHFARRILSPRELADFDPSFNSSTAVNFLALRWTAKEAAYKALYPHAVVTWHDLDVSKRARDPKPRLAFSTTSRFATDPVSQLLEMHLSVSHDAGFMTAYVVVEERATSRPA